MTNAANVHVGKPKAAGGIYSAPLTAAIPTTAVSALAAPFVNLGYISDSGLVNTIENDSEDIFEWGGTKVLSVRSSRNESFTFTFIETNANVLKEVYGQSNVTEVTASNTIAVLHNGSEMPRRVYVFEIALTDRRVKRIVVPSAQISEVGDVTYVAGEPIGYEVTLSTNPDSAGNTAYEYIALTT